MGCHEDASSNGKNGCGFRARVAYRRGSLTSWPLRLTSFSHPRFIYDGEQAPALMLDLMQLIVAFRRLIALHAERTLSGAPDGTAAFGKINLGMRTAGT